MRNFLLTVLMFITLSVTAQVQDMIFLKKGDPIKCNIANVSKERIKYFPLHNPDGNAYTIQISDVQMIRWANGNVKTFDVKPSDTIMSKHRRSWTLEVGGSNALGSANSPGISCGLIHQYGFQISNGVSVNIGGEFKAYNYKSDTLNGHSPKATNIWYIGIPLSLNIIKINQKAAWLMSITGSGGLRYLNTPNWKDGSSDATLGGAGHFSIMVGAGFKAKKTIIEIGPYVDYITYGVGSGAVGYGIHLSIVQ